MTPEPEKCILEVVAGIVEELNQLTSYGGAAFSVTGSGSVADLKCPMCLCKAAGFPMPLAEQDIVDLLIWRSLHKCKQRYVL